jgi:hypothetical protein
MIYKLSPSTNKNKKWKIETDTKTVHFGASGYEDYTIHKDEDRMKRYISRHKNNENWGKSGIGTAGFWSRWLLWNKSSLSASIKDTEKRFNIKITKTRSKS